VSVPEIDAKSLEQIEKLRDRFSSWGAAFASVCVVVAVWVTAPTLEVELPLASETKVSLNVGYVLAIAMPAITVTYAWILGALLSMRRYQAAVFSEDDSSHAAVSAAAQIKVRGSLSPSLARGRFERSIVSVALGVRLLILFAIPPLSEGWIAVRYFTDLQIYPEHRLEQERRVSAAEHLLGFGVVQWFSAGSPAPHELRFAITNGDLEQACRDKWEGKGSSTERCALDQFPRFVIPLTSWINALSLIAILLLSSFGARAYLRPPRRPPKPPAKA
jgi:hypothetical protein